MLLRSFAVRSILALALLASMTSSALAYTQTTAGMTFNGPSTYSTCGVNPGPDAVTITGVGGNTLKGAVTVSYNTDTGLQPIQTYPVNQTGDLNLAISYPPLASWPHLTNSNPPGTQEVHVDVSISAFSPSGAFLALFDGNLGGTALDWDVYCSGGSTPPPPPPPVCSISTSIASNFNGTSISAGNTIWFSSVLKVSGLGSQPVTIRFSNGTITGLPSAPGGLPVPNAAVTFSPSTTTATTIYDATTNTWVASLPMTFSGNAFLTGLPYVVPGNLAGGINPVTWNGTITSDTAGVSVNWQWAAAVFNTQTTPFPSDVNGLGVKPVDDTHVSVYQTSDHAGTPEYVKGAVIGGARGGGGSNFTGSYSGTASAKCS